MAYPSADAAESRKAVAAAETISASPTRRERLRARLMLAGLLSLAAVFWIAVFRLVVLA